MKKTLLVSIVACLALAVYAAQDSALSIRQVRDPVQLQAKLNANALDAETRLVAGGMTNGIATMEGGATLDNTTSAAELNITETTVKVTGALTVTGTPTFTSKIGMTNIATNSLGAKTITFNGVNTTNVLYFSAQGVLTNATTNP